MANINLLVASYGDEIIKYSNYNKSIHHGKIYCPSCTPSLRVTDSGKGYFKAWPNEGGHNCGIGQVKYLDSEWAGKYIVNSLKKGNQLDVSISLELLFREGQNLDYNRTNNTLDNRTKKIYYRYNEQKQVFRDVIRSVLQMKKIIEHSPYEDLKNINFYFKVADNESLNIDEAVLKSSDLNKYKHHNKYRFIIFKIEKIVPRKNEIYVNAYKSNGKSLSLFLKIRNNNKTLKVKENDYVIAFGKIIFSNKNNKFFFEITNDFQLQKINENKIEYWFKDVEFEAFNYNSAKDCKRADRSDTKLLKMTDDDQNNIENNLEFRNYLNLDTLNGSYNEKKELYEPNYNGVMSQKEEKAMQNLDEKKYYKIKTVNSSKKKLKKDSILKKIINKILNN